MRSPQGEPAEAAMARSARAERFEERLRHVQAARRRRRRRQVFAWLVGALVVLWVSWLFAASLGLLVAAVATAVIGAGSLVVGRLAARRGAAAWDWEAQRYRLVGRPAERVRDLDRPRDVPPSG